MFSKATQRNPFEVPRVHMDANNITCVATREYEDIERFHLETMSGKKFPDLRRREVFFIRQSSVL